MILNKRIKFFTYHGCMEQGKRRDNSPAADTKIDYGRTIPAWNECPLALNLAISAASSSFQSPPHS